jgi:hypothetical protein
MSETMSDREKSDQIPPLFISFFEVLMVNTFTSVLYVMYALIWLLLHPTDDKIRNKAFQAGISKRAAA